MDNSIWKFQIKTDSTIQQKSAMEYNYSVVLYSTTNKVTSAKRILLIYDDINNLFYGMDKKHAFSSCGQSSAITSKVGKFRSQNMICRWGTYTVVPLCVLFRFMFCQYQQC